MVLICRECGLLALHPDEVGSARVCTGGDPDYVIEGTSTRLGDQPARWATLEEVESKGWRQFVAGRDGVRWDEPAEG